MSYIKKQAEKEAAKHMAEGGTCKTISIFGVDVDVCVDENGVIMDDAMRKFAELTNQ